MTNFKPVSVAFRMLQYAVVAALVIGPWSWANAAAPAAAVVAVQPARVADIILLGGGFNAGLREGMVCRVARGGTEVGEVILVALRPTCSAALIVNLASKQSIRVGDVASVKVLKS